MRNHENQTLSASAQTEAADCSASAMDYKHALNRLWIELLKTVVFMIAALTLIVIGCIAWFSANNSVQAEGISVSARNEVIRIASKGVRQTTEADYLKLAEGTLYEYGEETYYYTEGGAIALRLSEDVVVSPGASGSIEFYIIPTRDGSMSVLRRHNLPNGDYELVPNPLDYIAFASDAVTLNGWSWTIPKNQYYNAGIVTTSIFDGTQFTMPLTAYVFTDQKNYANYKIMLTVSFKNDKGVRVTQSDANVVYTFACIKPSFFDPGASSAP